MKKKIQKFKGWIIDEKREECRRIDMVYDHTLKAQVPCVTTKNFNTPEGQQLHNDYLRYIKHKKVI